MGRTDLEHTTDIYIFVMPVVNQFDLFSFISSCFDFLVKEEGRKVCMYVCVGGGKKGMYVCMCRRREEREEGGGL